MKSQHLLRYVNKLRVTLSLIIILLFTSCSLLFHPSKSTSPLSIYIELPKGESALLPNCSERQDHFHVSIVNNSDNPKLIFKDSYSIGYKALTFEITDQHGYKTLIKRQDQSWLSNFPQYYIVNPKDQLTIDIFYKSNVWNTFSVIKEDEVKVVNIRAVLQQNVTELYGPWKKDEKYLWTGTIASPSYAIVLSKKQDLKIFANTDLLSTNYSAIE